jgi:hypothetical protein
VSDEIIFLLNEPRGSHRWMPVDDSHYWSEQNINFHNNFLLLSLHTGLKCHHKNSLIELSSLIEFTHQIPKSIKDGIKRI